MTKSSFGILVAIGLISASGAMAQRAPVPSNPLEQPAVEQLQKLLNETNRRLKERDAAIDNLMRRVQALEREKGRAPEVPVAQRPVAPSPSTPDQARPSAPNAAPSAPPAPGQITVDEIAAEHALERVLVQQGFSLLPSGSLEIEPAFTYSRNETAFPVIIPQNDTQFLIGGNQFRQNSYIGDVAFRLGLPWDMQFEVDVPVRYLDQRNVTSVGGAGQFSEGSGSGGFGDVTLTLSKTLLTEASWYPNLVANVQYSTNTGITAHGFNLGLGYSQVRGILTGSKRADPLAFVGSVAFGKGFESNNFSPGNEYDVTFGTVLAASPETSLRFLLQQRFLDEGEINGRRAVGSGKAEATFITGASVIIAPRTSLDFSVGIGLTSDAPKYYFRIGLPIRFDGLW